MKGALWFLPLSLLWLSSLYQGSITPIPDLSRVRAGSQRRVSTRVPANQVAGTPVSVVPVEVRYVR